MKMDREERIKIGRAKRSAREHWHYLDDRKFENSAILTTTYDEKNKRRFNPEGCITIFFDVEKGMHISILQGVISPELFAQAVKGLFEQIKKDSPV